MCRIRCFTKELLFHCEKRGELKVSKGIAYPVTFLQEDDTAEPSDQATLVPEEEDAELDSLSRRVAVNLIRNLWKELASTKAQLSRFTSIIDGFPEEYGAPVLLVCYARKQRISTTLLPAILCPIKSTKIGRTE